MLVVKRKKDINESKDRQKKIKKTEPLFLESSNKKQWNGERKQERKQKRKRENKRKTWKGCNNIMK